MMFVFNFKEVGKTYDGLITSPGIWTVMTCVGDTGRALDMASRSVDDAVAIWLRIACASRPPCSTPEDMMGNSGALRW